MDARIFKFHKYDDSTSKKLYLDNVATKTNKEIEVFFVPGHIDEYQIIGNKLVINFFKIMVDLNDFSKIIIAEKPFKEYIEEKILNM